MEAKVRKELDTLLTMVQAWRDCHIASAGGQDGWEFLSGDLRQEIEEHVYPYVHRMYECKYLTSKELATFLDCCYDEVALLKKHLATIPAEV